MKKTAILLLLLMCGMVWGSIRVVGRYVVSGRDYRIVDANGIKMDILADNNDMAMQIAGENQKSSTRDVLRGEISLLQAIDIINRATPSELNAIPKLKLIAMKSKIDGTITRVVK